MKIWGMSWLMTGSYLKSECFYDRFSGTQLAATSRKDNQSQSVGRLKIFLKHV